MKIGDLNKQKLNKGSRLEAVVTTPDGPKTVWFESENIDMSENYDAFVCAALIPAMTLGNTLEVDGKVSERLMKGLLRIQAKMNEWYSHLKLVDVKAEPCARSSAQKKAAAVFFSGGVDSYYSYLSHEDEIESLVLVHGFDVRLERTELFNRIRESLSEGADALHKKFIVVRTNLREVFDDYSRWQPEYYGSALAAVAHILSNGVDRIFLPASTDEDNLLPAGSHPETDPYFSSEIMNIIHDGLCPRSEKIEAIADNRTVQKTLRVCWENRGNKYNCSACEKCLRTMLPLSMSGRLPKFETFDDEIDFRLVARMDSRTRVQQIYMEESLELAARYGAEEHAEAIREAMSGLYQRGFWGYPQRALNLLRRKAKALFSPRTRTRKKQKRRA